MVTHPGAIEVAVSQGAVTLSGPVLKHERDGLLRGVRETPGVSGVEDRLEAHEQAGSVPGLEEAGVPREHRFELLQENWSPTARLFAGLAGVGLGLAGARRRGALGAGLAAIGSGILVRAVTNRPLARLREPRPGRQEAAAPPEQGPTEAHGDEVAREEAPTTEDAAAPPPPRRPASRRRRVPDPTRPGDDTATTGMTLKPE